MSSSPSITLFSERPELHQQPYSLLVSVLSHIVVIGLLSFGILTAPKVKTPVIADRYDVRQLELHTLESEMRRAIKSSIKAPSPHTNHSGGSTAQHQPILSLATQAPRGPQTLIQPDIPKPVTLPFEIPVPTVVIWSGKKTAVKTIVAPVPEKPPVLNVKPVIQVPNDATRLSDLAIPAAHLPEPPQPILPSTTSPVVVSGPKPTPPAPITTAAASGQPTPTALMSLSDSRMTNGSVNLPPVNESVASNAPGALSPGHGKDSSQAGKGSSAGKAGNDAGDSHNPNGDEQGGASGSGLMNQPSTTHIKHPIEGQFGSVIVGASLEDQFPQTADVWSGRMAYTVYLHVGLTKNWILQYSLSRADNAAAAGNISHLDAPWPYNIIRPNLAPGSLNGDALMIHGFVNQDGRFESLAVAFPPDFPMTRFVLNSLAQWQFRPATMNGQNVKVEVLLIIPEEPE